MTIPNGREIALRCPHHALPGLRERGGTDWYGTRYFTGDVVTHMECVYYTLVAPRPCHPHGRGADGAARRPYQPRLSSIFHEQLAGELADQPFHFEAEEGDGHGGTG